MADGARRRGQRFGAETLAELAGRAHDLGKYGPDFQARVRGAARKADHSTAGAAWAAGHLPRKKGVHGGIGRTRGGLNSRLHAVCDRVGRPIILLLTEGQASDQRGAAAIIDALPKTGP